VSYFEISIGTPEFCCLGVLLDLWMEIL
jgi:hypothetical protein